MTVEELQELLRCVVAEEQNANFAEAEQLAIQAIKEIDAYVASSETDDQSDNLRSLRVEALRLVASVKSRIGNTIEALEYCREALQIAETFHDRGHIANISNTLGNIYQRQSSYSLAQENYTRAIHIHEELHDKAGLARVMGNLGNVYFALSDFSVALDYYSRALAIHEEVRDKSAMADVMGNIGSVYASLSDYTMALDYFTRTLALDEEVGNTAGAAQVLGNIGIVHRLLGNYKEALEYYNRALRIHEEVGNKASEALVTGNIGKLYIYVADYPLAYEYLMRALSLQETLDQKLMICTSKESLGGFFTIKENPNHDEARAEQFLLEAVAIHQELGTKNYTLHKTLSELYEGQGRLAESLRHLKKYQHIKDEVQSEEATRSVALLEQNKEIGRRDKQLSVERAESQSMQKVLHQVLPVSIASRLMRGEKIADYFQNVSILFADIVGFTPIASRMPAKAVLAFLNYVFGEFDRMVSDCGREKIKTIGDGYLAVAGAPVSCEDHAERIAKLAMEMSKDIILPEEIRKTLPKGAQFSLRIGIHTGPCFGGIVGENRFVYDIYSDAVNLAARMESHGEPGKIHISDDYCFHLQNRMDMTGEDLGGIRFDEREEMEIKGKGRMRTYFLEIP